MKKISVSLLILMICFFITGCGTTSENNKSSDKEQKLVCTTTENDEGLVTEEVISMIYRNNKLKRMTMEVNSKIIDSDVQENWEDFKSYMDKDNEEFSEDGITLKVDVNDAEYEYKVTLDIDVENATEEKLKEQGFEGLKDDNSTLEQSKEAAEKDGAVCTIE